MVAVMPPASAVGCNGTSCTGKNPQTQGCGADAKTLTEYTYYSLRVELRKSAACNAAWVRATLPADSEAYAGYVAGVVAYDCSEASAGCRIGYKSVSVSKGERKYSKTWTFTDWVRGCNNTSGGQPLLPVVECSARV